MNRNVANAIKRIVEKGDALAYSELVDRFAGSAFGVAFAILGNREDACDITQDALVMAYKMLPALRDRSKFGAWLKRIVAGLSKNFLRDSKRRLAASAAAAQHDNDAAEEPIARMEVREQNKAVYSQILSLPERHRTVIIMKYLEGMHYQDIASFLEIGLRSVKTLASEAKRLLLARMERQDANINSLGHLRST